MITSLEEAVRTLAARQKSVTNVRAVGVRDPIHVDHGTLAQIERLTGVKWSFRRGRTLGDIRTVADLMNAVVPKASVQPQI